MPRRATVVALVLALLGALLDLPRQSISAADARPDIVLFYLDDFAPYPARLWDDPARTPELARFVDHGLSFENAIVSSPLCGPARANLLTGRYGHRTGVTENDIGSYDQRGTIAPRLAAAGYRTAFIGKHINGLRSAYPTRRAMRPLTSGWDRFDVIWEDQGRFFDWTQYRKDGSRHYGQGSLQHSTYVAAKRAAGTVLQTPTRTPLFMVVSLVDGHKPLTPLKRFEGDPACADVGRWSGPAFNEADVSDKPHHIRATPKLPMNAYPLRARCEQLLTVDWVVATVRRALQRSGRLANTLQVLTADNGWLMGDHRIEGKTYPYATPVPLFMRWPAVLGNDGRRIEEPVSNVDFGRTFCALAGCKLPGSDGKSLVPLIRGTRAHLDRRFLYVELLHASRYPGRASARPAWAGVETTLGYSDRRWAFTRYQTGEEELYDLTADPHRLSNLVGVPAHQDVRKELRGFWREIRDRDGVHWLGRIRAG